MGESWNVVELDEDEVIVDEATGDEWIWETKNRHGMIINLQKFVNINFHLFHELF